MKRHGFFEFTGNGALACYCGRVCADQWSMIQHLTGDTGGAMSDSTVEHPPHYTAYRGVEVIQLTEHMNFCRGNAVKYLARAGLKEGADELEDLRKAKWYVEREILRVQAMRDGTDEG